MSNIFPFYFPNFLNEHILHKNNKANFNEDLKVDEAFIFGNYGASVVLISKWNLNHLNDPREGTVVGIILSVIP